MNSRSGANPMRNRFGSMARSCLAIAVILAASACGDGPQDGSSGNCSVTPSSVPYDFDFETVTDGFDNYGSIPGAAVGVAINTAEDAAIVVAMTFNQSTTFSQTFEASCDVNGSRESYEGYQYSPGPLLDIADNYVWIRSALTDSQGALNMKYDFTAFLIIKNEGVYMAKEGSLTLTRTPDGTTASVLGSLTFVEMTGMTQTAEIDPAGDTLLVEDISFSWDTVEQP
jgi:hypothetical protein